MEDYLPLIAVLVVAVAAEGAWFLAAAVTKPSTSRYRLVKVTQQVTVWLCIAAIALLGAVFISDGQHVGGSLLLVAAIAKVAIELLARRADLRAQVAA